MLLKVLFRFREGKDTIARRFEIANVSHSNDDIDILNSTVLQKVIEGLQTMFNGGRFIVTKNEVRQLKLSFDEVPEDNRKLHFNVPTYIFTNGNLKFFA